MKRKGVNIENMCSRKAAFKYERKAQEKAAKYGYRAYQCPICGKWHLTSDVKD